MPGLGTHRCPYTARKDGFMCIKAPMNGSVWISIPGGGLLALDIYGPVPELVVFGGNTVKVRSAGCPLESAYRFDSKTGLMDPVTKSRG